MCLDHVIMLDNYLVDNGVFKVNRFVQHILKHNQCILYCVVNSHYQNGVAERLIHTDSEMDRAMMLQLSLIWENGIGSNLWLMDTSYGIYIYNHMPNSKDIDLDDLFTGTKFTRQKLKYIHLWFCPVYV